MAVDVMQSATSKLSGQRMLPKQDEAHNRLHLWTLRRQANAVSNGVTIREYACPRHYFCICRVGFTVEGTGPAIASNSDRLIKHGSVWLLDNGDMLVVIHSNETVLTNQSSELKLSQTQFSERLQSSVARRLPAGGCIMKIVLFARPCAQGRADETLTGHIGGQNGVNFFVKRHKFTKFALSNLFGIFLINVVNLLSKCKLFRVTM